MNMIQEHEGAPVLVQLAASDIPLQPHDQQVIEEANDANNQDIENDQSPDDEQNADNDNKNDNDIMIGRRTTTTETNGTPRIKANVNKGG